MNKIIDTKENVAIIVPTSPQEFTGFCRTVMQELRPTQGARPKTVPMTDAHIKRICRGMGDNKKQSE